MSRQVHVDRILRAWNDPGPSPSHHLRAANALRQNWPVLADSLDKLTSYERPLMETTLKHDFPLLKAKSLSGDHLGKEIRFTTTLKDYGGIRAQVSGKLTKVIHDQDADHVGILLHSDSAQHPAFFGIYLHDEIEVL